MRALPSRKWMAAGVSALLVTASCTSSPLKSPIFSTSNVSASYRSSVDIGFLAALQSRASTGVCGDNLVADIPRRTNSAQDGSVIMQQVMGLGGESRDAIVAAQVLDGNVPSFIRNLTPVSFAGHDVNGQAAEIIICVTPDYLAVGDDDDFVRVSLGLPAAAQIADEFGFFLPTTKMVDAIYEQAAVQLAPRPMEAGNRMTSTSYLLQHDQTIDGQLAAYNFDLEELVAGQKKDLVLSDRLRSHPGQVAIYGWHRTDGNAIQPLSTVHGAEYEDYSHGIRLVSATAYLNGKEIPLESLMQDPQLAAMISDEGPINLAQALQSSLYR